MLEFLKNNKDKPLPTKVPERLAYGAGDFASCILYASVTTFLMYYYTDYAKVDVAIVATIMAVSRFFDGFSDIFVGHLIERTVSPFGKARVWILRMLIPYVIGCTLMFMVPTWASDWIKYIYIFVTYNFAITIVYTAINLPYGAMNTMMTQDNYERSVIVIYRMVMASGGSIFVSVVTMPLVKFFGNDAHAWTYTYFIVGLMGASIFFITFALCHERFAAPVQESKPGDFKRAMKNLFTNKYWIILTLSMVLVCTATVAMDSVNIYVCKYFLKNDELVGIYGTIANLCRIGCMILIMSWLVKIIGKRNCLLIAFVFIAIGMIARIMDPYSITAFYVTATCYGLAQGFIWSALFAMIPDTVEYGEFKDHERHEGYIYAGASFGTKVGAGIGPVMAGGIMSFGGYDATLAEQTPSAMNALLMANSGIPLVLIAVTAVLMLGYKLDGEYPAIIEELRRRHAVIKPEEDTAQTSSEA
ncbi:MAG: glycoside-pentoside-hexuronide (GPH):cation symporter [Succinivibrio sp.]|nr:glycoside-pentoside-hexuronide (GPH):cation symporter [Succinivibrio sp.]